MARRETERDVRSFANIARAVLRERLDRKWSQARLAKRARTTQCRISQIEALSGNPRLATLNRVLNALDMEILVVPSTPEPRHG